MDIEIINNLDEVSELEPLVISSLSKIEQGLKNLERQVNIGKSGRPDILAVDRNGSLIIIELKSVTANIHSLSQIIRYYEWFVQNLALVCRPFPEIKPHRDIRLFIVAPKFDDDSIRMAKYINLGFSLFKYVAVKNTETNEVGIVFEIIELQRQERPGIELRSIEDIISYFIDEELKDEFRKVLDDLKNIGIQCKPYQGGKDHWIECSFQVDTVAYLQPRQKYFNCQLYDEDTEKFIWPPIKLSSYEEWVKECKGNIVEWTNE